jgi:hypothetical protein
MMPHPCGHRLCPRCSRRWHKAHRALLKRALDLMKDPPGAASRPELQASTGRRSFDHEPRAGRPGPRRHRERPGPSRVSARRIRDRRAETGARYACVGSAPTTAPTACASRPFPRCRGWTVEPLRSAIFSERRWPRLAFSWKGISHVFTSS